MIDAKIIDLPTFNDRIKELQTINVDDRAIDLFLEKWDNLVIKVKGLSCGEANILKQLAIGVGADFAIHKEAITGKVKKTDALFFGTRRQLKKLINRLSNHPFRLPLLKDTLFELLKEEQPKLRLREKEIVFDERPYIMGTINVTPDSLYAGGKYLSPEKAVERGLKLLEEGADIIGIGSKSTTPGANSVPKEVELKRILTPLRILRKKTNSLISVDTCMPEVAEISLKEGADIINDTSGGRYTDRMALLLKEEKAGYVLMHGRGTPPTMQIAPYYKNFMDELHCFFKEKLKKLKQLGANQEQIIIDPGIGFGKRLKDNYEIVKRAGELRCFKRPILAGVSKKYFIENAHSLPPEEQLEDTIATSILLYLHGVNILRVLHSVKEIKKALDFTYKVMYD